VVDEAAAETFASEKAKIETISEIRALARLGGGTGARRPAGRRRRGETL